MPHSSRGLLKNPIERSDPRSVREAKAVPSWQATIPRKLMVVACRYAWCSGEPGPTSSPGCHPARSRT